MHTLPACIFAWFPHKRLLTARGTYRRAEYVLLRSPDQYTLDEQMLALLPIISGSLSIVFLKVSHPYLVRENMETA